MKLSNVRFLANANIKGNKKSNVVMVLMIILVISLTLVSSFSVTVTSAVTDYKNDTRARMLEVDPWNKELDAETIKSIENVDHVSSVDTLKGIRSQYFNTSDISDEDKSNTQQVVNQDCLIQAWSLIGDEKRDVIAGENLDEAPTFSCIIPSLFYPFDDENSDENLDYIDGESLIGKTIMVKPYNNSLELLYNFEGRSVEQSGNEWVYLPALEYKLKIVGVYYSQPVTYGYYDSIFISEETGEQIVQMALDASKIDLTSDTNLVSKWWNNESLRTHYVTVDDFDNIDYVYNQLTDMGISCADSGEYGINESIPIISNIFSFAGIFLIIATSILCIINLIQSTTNSLTERKGEIGLLKAIGYRQKQIFACLYYEQLKTTLSGCGIGAVVSAVVIFISNLIFSHKDYISFLYIVKWSDYLFFLAISVLVAIVIPLACQLISLYKLGKIEPKDAMN